jgi:NADH-quinone oxidoreductase subunit J
MIDFPLGSLLWWVFASLAVGGGMGMVTRFGLAGIYLLLGAHFIAAIQIIVYAGAIMVLFLFVIMLLNLGHDYQADMRGGLWIVAGFVAAGTMGWLLWSIVGTPGARYDRGGAAQIAADVEQLNAVGAIAYPLFRNYIVPFELVGILLLVAIVGAVVLAKRRI